MTNIGPQEKAETYVYAGRIREYISENYALKTSKDFIHALNKKITGIMDTACELAMEDRRKTVKGRDAKYPCEVNKD